jgi:hypothetical protein
MQYISISYMHLRKINIREWQRYWECTQFQEVTQLVNCLAAQKSLQSEFFCRKRYHLGNSDYILIWNRKILLSLRRHDDVFFFIKKNNVLTPTKPALQQHILKSRYQSVWNLSYVISMSTIIKSPRLMYTYW